MADSPFQKDLQSARQLAAQQIRLESKKEQEKGLGEDIKLGGTLLGALIGTIAGGPAGGLAGAQVGGAAGGIAGGIIAPPEEEGGSSKDLQTLLAALQEAEGEE